MRPIALKGHDRAITHLVYNRDGDFLFTSAKNKQPVLWNAETGERLGTFEGHDGAVWCLSVSGDSRHLLSASADQTVRLWSVRTGKELYCFHHQTVMRSVHFAHGDRMFLAVSDRVRLACSTIFIYDLSKDPRDQNDTPILKIPHPDEKCKFNHAYWGPLNETIFTCSDNGSIHIFDAETGDVKQVIKDHARSVPRISFDKKQIFFITSSEDGTARLYDTKTLQHKKTYDTGIPINSASVSPLKDHVILGGGQSSSQVTTTRVDAKQFATKFFHLFLQDELGSIGGHFGPIHILSFSPDGKSFASGSEDGYARIYHLDDDYFDNFGIMRY